MKSLLIFCASLVLLSFFVACATSTSAKSAGEEPALRLGVMSDIHLTWHVDEPGSYERIQKVLEYYRDRNVDGVVIAGDIADWGFVGQLEQFGELWRKVFPGDRAPDGHSVARLFIGGNHDFCGPYEPYKYKGKPIFEMKEEFIKTVGMDKAWEKAFGEKYEPVWFKEVKGYAFTGAHWGSESKLPAFLVANGNRIDRTKPYFHIQHPHPLGTVYPGMFPENSWNYDHGAAMKALADFPNAIVLSGHTHLPLTDERGISQGAFTSIGTGSLSYVWHLGGRENSKPGNDHVAQMGEINPWPWKNPDRGHHILYFEVFGDRIEIERIEAFNLASLGENWVVPLDFAKRPYDISERAMSFPPPEFPRGAKLAVSGPAKGRARNGAETMQVDVRFPSASAGKSRPYEYEVAVERRGASGWERLLARRIFSPTYHLALEDEAAEANCVFAANELPAEGKCRFVVTPLSSFGTCGKSLSAPFSPSLQGDVSARQENRKSGAMLP